MCLRPQKEETIQNDEHIADLRRRLSAALRRPHSSETTASQSISITGSSVNDALAIQTKEARQENLRNFADLLPPGVAHPPHRIRERGYMTVPHGSTPAPSRPLSRAPSRAPTQPPSPAQGIDPRNDTPPQRESPPPDFSLVIRAIQGASTQDIPLGVALNVPWTSPLRAAALPLPPCLSAVPITRLGDLSTDLQGFPPMRRHHPGRASTMATTIVLIALEHRSLQTRCQPHHV